MSVLEYMVDINLLKSQINVEICVAAQQITVMSILNAVFGN